MVLDDGPSRARPSQHARIADQAERDTGRRRPARAAPRRAHRRSAGRVRAPRRRDRSAAARIPGQMPMPSPDTLIADPGSRHLVILRYRLSRHLSAPPQDASRARPVACSNLFATTEAVRHNQRPGRAARTAGSSTRSPTACDTANLSASKPNAPAMPQQPESGNAAQAHLPEQRLLMAHLHDRLLMAMPVEQDLPRDAAARYGQPPDSRSSDSRNV